MPDAPLAKDHIISELLLALPQSHPNGIGSQNRAIDGSSPPTGVCPGVCLHTKTDLVCRMVLRVIQCACGRSESARRVSSTAAGIDWGRQQ